MSKTIKILDLFAGTQSVRKALELDKTKTEYIGVDIYSPEQENLIFDLTQDNIVSKLRDALPKDWTPDFIWASPVCNKVSKVLTGKGGNYYFEVINNDIIPRTNWNIKVQPHMNKYQNKEGWEKAREDAIMAKKLHSNTKKIIEYFNVPFAIENPAGALSKYIYKNLKVSLANYCMYGFDYPKTTAFYTNKELNLKRCDRKLSKHIHASLLGEKGKTKPSHWNKNVSSYANRSSVPPKLIQEIIKQLLKGGQ